MKLSAISIVLSVDPVSTIIITQGELKRSDHFVCGKTLGKIRAMLDFDGKNIDKAYPSTPIEILGMNESANAGDEFLVVENEDEAKKINDFQKAGSKASNTLRAYKADFKDFICERSSLNPSCPSSFAPSSKYIE